MSDDENQLDLENSKLEEEPIVKPVLTPNPFDMVNNSLMQMTLSFEPLKAVLNSILEAQKINKLRIDQLTSDGLSFKKHMDSVEERFVVIQSKIGDIDPDNIVKLDDLDRGYYDINDASNEIKLKIKSALSNDIDVDKMRKIYDETNKSIAQLNKQLYDCENRTSGYIAISERREEKQKLIDKERNFNIYPEDSDEEEGSAKNMSSTDENLNGDLNDNAEKDNLNSESNNLGDNTNASTEESKRDNMLKQLKYQKHEMDLLMQSLEKLKQKENDTLKMEEAKKPQITFDMIKQFKQAYTIAIEDRQKLDNIESEFRLKLQELNMKVGSKLDILEFDTVSEDLKKNLKDLTIKFGLLSENRRRQSTVISNIPQELVSSSKFDDSGIRKFIERSIDEVNKTTDSITDRIENLENSYSKFTSDIKQIKEIICGKPESNREILLLESEVKELTKKVDKFNAETPIINYKLTSQESKPKEIQTSRIIINNNADKLSTEKKFRDVEKLIADLRRDTFNQFDYTEDTITKFKLSVNKILERQDQSILSILTRLTSLEIRVDGLEADGIKNKTIDTGLGKDRGRQNKQEILESLLIAQKLVEDFKELRKELIGKVYELEQANKTKASIYDLSQLDQKYQDRFTEYDNNTKKFKNDLINSLKKMQERISKQSLMQRPLSPAPELDTSAILSKRNINGFKCANCDKDLGQLEKKEPGFDYWNKMPRRKSNQKMVHMGKGYSKLLQSYNFDTLSPDNSFKLNDHSESDNLNHNSILKTLDNRELDPSGLDISCKRKLPHIRSSSNFKRFSENV